MRRAPSGNVSASELGPRALAAAVAALPEATPGSATDRAFSEGNARPRAALLALVERTAFEILASAVGAAELAAPPADWPFGAEAFAPARGAVRAALAELGTLGGDPDSAGNADFGPDALGAVYEGMLATSVELARVPSAVVAEPRAAGNTQVDRLVDASGLTRAESKRATLVPAGRVALVQSVDRRRSGSHYTPRALADRVVAATLGPLLGPTPAPEKVLEVCACDPSLGTGAFLLAVCRFLAARLEAGGGAPSRAQALRRVAECCLFGVDRDGGALVTARHALWLAVADPALPLTAFDARLREGDALVGAPEHGVPPRHPRPPTVALDWERAFPEVFARGGFDAFVGNPPWVSYAGRASQPLAPEMREVYDTYAAFHGYKNLQGLFVERAARLLRPGGRLGFVLPSSMSELAGYAPTRRAHDRFATVDPELPDLGA
ncbi:MAG TPA: hypothetical protein VGQ57_21205, partial [Polyangiaceae bacterium]|nr:hypothetical protein [Polyangiaceae bacterium]